MHCVRMCQDGIINYTIHCMREQTWSHASLISNAFTPQSSARSGKNLLKLRRRRTCWTRPNPATQMSVEAKTLGQRKQKHGEYHLGKVTHVVLPIARDRLKLADQSSQCCIMLYPKVPDLLHLCVHTTRTRFVGPDVRRQLPRDAEGTCDECADLLRRFEGEVPRDSYGSLMLHTALIKSP